MTRSRTLATTLVAATAAVGLAACSSSGGKTTTDSSSASAGKASTPSMTVAMITHSKPGDSFWDQVRKGAQAAADKDNVTFEYSNDSDATKQASLVQAAVDKKVDGIAVTLAKPDALKASVKAAQAAGIPVDGLNSGTDKAKEFGLIGFFGQDERIAGQAAGERLAAAGAKAPLCIIHEQGNVGLNDRCAGVKEKVPATTILYVDGADLSAAQSAITAKLQQDKAIDWIVSLNGGVTSAAIKAEKSASSSAKVGTFDTSAEIVKGIKDGSVAWAVDQQPWLQGYLAVDALWLAKNAGTTIGGGQPTLTGPAFIDKTNVAAVEKFAAAGTR